MDSSFNIDYKFASLLKEISDEQISDSDKKKKFISEWNKFVASDECKTWEENRSALSWGTSSVGEMCAGKDCSEIFNPTNRLSEKFKFLYTAPAKSAAEDDLGWVKFERLSFPKIQTNINMMVDGVNFSFANCNFLYKATFIDIKKLKFTSCTFKGKFIAGSGNKLELNHSNLTESVDIANIKEINFNGTIFNGYTSLDITNCQKLPNFAAAHFNNTQHLKLTDNRAEGKFNTSRFKIVDDVLSQNKPADTYRFLKNYYAKDNHLKAKHAYFKLELKHTFKVLYFFYNLFSNCGLSVWRPLLLLMLGCLFTYCIAQYLGATPTNCWQGGNILIRTINPFYFKCHDATNIFSSLWLVAHTLWNGLMLFLIGLGLRNTLKLKH